MSKQQNEQRREIYYQKVRFCQGFQMALGQSHSTQFGHLIGSTKKAPTRYSARWIVGSPMLFLRWMSNDGKVIEYDVPVSQVMGCTRIPADDEPAPLTLGK